MKIAAIFDSETSGIEPKDHVCLEVAVQLFNLELGVPLSSFSSLIKSDRNEAESINRIPVAALTDATEYSSVWKTIAHFFNKADVIIAHRASFDHSFTPPDVAALKPWVCSKFHIQWALGKNGDGLVHLALAHGVGVVSAHRAMTDVDILSRLFTRVHEMGHNLPDMIKKAMRPRVRLQGLQKFEDNDKAKAAGFSWDGNTKRWIGEMFVDDVAALTFRTVEI